MIIKQKGFSACVINRFDLLGANEVGLSKAFAYLLAAEPRMVFRFLNAIGINIKNTLSNFERIQIEVERKRSEGRTDIEIYLPQKFHIIIECKLKKNQIKQQRFQYFPAFNNSTEKNILCFITQERDSTHDIANEVDVHYKGWLDIVDMLEPQDIEASCIAREFASYVTRGFKMRNQKEVLIQDVANQIEVQRFLENGIYRRNVTFGSPLYFAPYFTRKSGQVEGISYLSQVLGVITATPQVILNFKDELRLYADNDEVLVKKWLNGLELGSIHNDSMTYYFLAEPVKLDTPLLKDRSKAEGRGKNWISGMISRNRCVTFAQFTQRIVMAQTSLP